MLLSQDTGRAFVDQTIHDSEPTAKWIYRSVVTLYTGILQLIEPKAYQRSIVFATDLDSERESILGQGSHSYTKGSQVHKQSFS